MNCGLRGPMCKELNTPLESSERAASRAKSCPETHGQIQTLECYGSLVRTGLGAVFAHSVCVGGVAIGPDRIGVGTAIARNGDDHHAVARNIHAARRRTAPREIDRVAPLHLVAGSGQRDPGCRCRCRSSCWCRCRRRAWYRAHAW